MPEGRRIVPSRGEERGEGRRGGGYKEVWGYVIRCVIFMIKRVMYMVECGVL